MRQRAASMKPYVPGLSVEEVVSRFGLSDAVKLASNENPLGASPAALEAAAKTPAHVYPDRGARALTQRLAAHLGAPEELICIGAGADELIRVLCEIFIEPGDNIVIAEPTFSQYAASAHLRGGEVIRVPLRGGVHDLEAMAAAAGPRTKLAFVCNPNNPTATCVPSASVEDFLERVPEGALVVFDEAYYEFADDPAFPDTVAWLKQGRRVAVLRTFSKVYGLAGMRVGYGLLPAEVAAAYRRVRDPFSVSAPAQAAAVAALEDQEHVQRTLQMNRDGRAYLRDELTRMGFSVAPSQSNFLWVDVGGPSRPIFEALLRRGVIVRAGEAFDSPNHLRITVGTPEQNRRLLDALYEILQPSGAEPTASG